jgi:hypothetical protein
VLGDVGGFEATPEEAHQGALDEALELFFDGF